MKRLFSVLWCVALLAACTANDPPQVEQTWVAPAPLPLPPGAVMEEAGQANRPMSREFLGSFRPDHHTPEERVPQILARGRIIVGVDQSQYLLSFRDPNR